MRLRITLKLLILGLLGICLIVLKVRDSQRMFAAEPKQTNALVESQADVPVRISSLAVDFSNALEPKVTYFVANTSGKPISAYAIRYVVNFNETRDQDVDLRYGLFSETVFQPTRVETGSFEGREYEKPVKEVRLAVDFVEFADGTTWGPDTFKSAEQLGGLRQGAEDEIAGLIKIKRTGTLSAVQNALTTFAPTPPMDRSSEWVDGFRSGVAAIRSRLERASKQGGAKALDESLSLKVYRPGRRQI